MFKLKIKQDEMKIIDVKGEKISDFDPIFKQLKKKYGDKFGNKLQ